MLVLPFQNPNSWLEVRVESMHCDAFTGISILTVDFIIINYISAKFIFEEKQLNKISENKITCYTAAKEDIV